MNEITLSVITVVFNGKEFIEPTVKSVIEQELTSLEYIVVDGGSTDGTLDVLKKYTQHLAHFVTGPDAGVYDAMNKGLALAKGKYVLFLNAGDTLSHPGLLRTLFVPCPDADVLFGETNLLNEKREMIGTRSALTSRKLPENLVLRDFLKGQVVSHQSFIAKRSLAPMYSLAYKCSADIAWMIEIVKKGKNTVNVGQAISNYLQGGISDRQLATCWWERFQILWKNFNPFWVISAHLHFMIRFFNYGRYKQP
ncbi:MAG: glycosyltransferase [Cyclobacteriaceae bacterium]|nr:glycosyltransferase [Cyclobacteriaceae bacterium]